MNLTKKSVNLPAQAGLLARPRDVARRQMLALLTWVLLGICLAAHPGYLAADENEAAALEAGWWKALATGVGQSPLASAELAGLGWNKFAEHLSMDEPRYLATYAAYGNGEKLWVMGRVLANGPARGPRSDDRWWDNLLASYQRWETDEVPGAEILLRWGGQERQVMSDHEGYYAANFEIFPDSPIQSPVLASHELQENTILGTHRVFMRPDAAQTLIISDMDDTVIYTGLSSLRVAAQQTFLNNARTRKPLAGVAELYHALVRGPDGEADNPVFYVSNSGWNLWDLLRDFLELNDLPRGPLLLRDLGREADTEDHKIVTIRQIVERFPDLPVLLIGDSGQHDAEIYTEIAQAYPDRVLAIYLRDVDPQIISEDDRRVRAVTSPLADLDITYKLVGDSVEIANSVAGLGLIDAEQIERVRQGVQRDRAR